MDPSRGPRDHVPADPHRTTGELGGLGMARARIYDIVWIGITAFFLICWMVWGGDGWLLMALFASVGSLRGFAFVLQMSHYSWRFISVRLSTSTNGEVFATWPAIGLHKTSAMIEERIGGPDEHPQYGNPKKVEFSVFAWPEVVFIELGTARWGPAGKWGGKEHGFAIINKAIFEKLEPGHNIVAHGNEVVLKAVNGQLLALLRLIRPMEEDRRGMMPAPWFN